MSGWVDGIASEARFAQPSGIAVDGAGNIYVSDNIGLRMITPGGGVMTFIQQSGPPLLNLAGLAVDAAGLRLCRWRGRKFGLQDFARCRRRRNPCWNR